MSVHVHVCVEEDNGCEHRFISSKRFLNSLGILVALLWATNINRTCICCTVHDMYMYMNVYR